MIYIAGYRGKKRFLDRLIQWWTGDTYSHCEVVINNIGYSSSHVDGGVRSKWIDFQDSTVWDLYPIEFADAEDIIRYYQETKCTKYYMLDLILSQVLRTRLNIKNSQFCSEWCANALRLPDPRSHTPGSLIRLIVHLNWMQRCAKLS